MPKRRRRTTRNGGEENLATISPSAGAQQSAVVAGDVAGRPTPDHELSVLGFGNPSRYYDHDDPKNGPACVFRRVHPLAGFYWGWSATSTSPSNVDWQSAVDTQLSPSSALYGVTEIAKALEFDVWPINENLLTSGTGSRPPISLQEWVRYQAMVLAAYGNLATIVQINNLAYHFDWTKVWPFSPHVPKYILDMATLMNATDVGIAEFWLPEMKRLENRVAWPRVVAEYKRLLTPFHSVDLNGRLMIPMNFDPFDPANTPENILNAVRAWNDYLNEQMSNTDAVLTTFIPFPLANANPWIFPQAPVMDFDRATGWMNSGVSNFEPFGPVAAPLLSEGLCFNNPDPNLAWFTRHTQPVYAEVRNASIWTTDGSSWIKLITPHAYSKCWVVDDADEIVDWGGVPIGPTDKGYRYSDFTMCRYANSDVDYGNMIPGTMGAEITEHPVTRLQRIDVEYMWNLNLLKDISRNMMGASLRELRMSIAQALSRAQVSPF